MDTEQDTHMDRPNCSRRTHHGKVAPIPLTASPDPVIIEEVSLKRSIGFLDGVMLVIGAIIGSGIFISPTGVAIGSGSVGLSLVSWCVCGGIAIIGGLCIAELGTVVPESGAEYAYIKAAFGRPWAYMYAWVAIMLLKPSSVTIISMTCAKYISTNFFQDGCGNPPSVIVKLMAAAIILVMCVINCYSVTISSRMSVVFTFCKVSALVIIIFGGFVRLGQGHTQHLSTGFTGSETNAGTIAIGLYNGLWAYDGWNQLAYITEELKNPSKNLPRCIIVGVITVTVLYILTNISYFTVMSTRDLVESPAVAMTWADEVIPVVSWLIPVSVAMSTFGAANLAMLSTSRVNFVAARDGLMVNTLSMIHVSRFTPVPALISLSAMAMLWTLPGDVGTLIDYFSFAVWTSYGMCMAALIVLRFTRKHADRPFKVPIILPIIMVLISIFLVIAPIIQSPSMEQLYAFIVIVAGFIFYVPFVHFQYKLPGTDALTTLTQLVFQISPSMTIDDNN